MNKPQIYKKQFRFGGTHYVPAVEYEVMRIYAEFLERKLQAHKTKSTRAKPVNWNGQTWPSLTALAKHCNTMPQSLRYYIKKRKQFAGSYIEHI